MPGTVAGAARASGALHQVAGPPRTGGLGQHVSGLWQHAFAVQPVPPAWLIAASGVLALAVVGSPRAWRAARIVVTSVHEGGHALLAVATGRRLAGVRMYRNTAGVTVSAGRPGGPGLVLTTAAGYPAPSLLGVGAAALLGAGHLTGMLLLSLVLLAGLAVAVRNAYGLLTVAASAGLVIMVSLSAPAVVQAAFGYTLAWFLLLGGIRPVIELQYERRRDRRRGQPRRSDADQLARLTLVPGGAWVLIFGVLAIAALALGARWLIR